MRTPRSIRWKLWLGAVALVALPLLFLNQRTVRSFDSFTSRTQQANMHAFASVVSGLYRLHLPDATGEKALPREDLKREVDALARRTGARIRIYDTQRRIVVDSDPDQPLPLEIPTPPPEVVEAFSGGWSARSRLLTDNSRYYYFLAQPVKDDEKNVKGVAYVIMHTGAITSAILEMVERHRLTLFATLATTTVTSLLLGWAVTHRLRKLTRAVRAHAREGGALTTTVGGRDEIGELADALRGMARELDERYIYNHDFVRTLFHELGTPVHTIQGSLELLEDDTGPALTPEQHAELLANIRHESDRIETLVRDLRKQTRFDADRILGGRETVDVAQLVASTVRRWCAGTRRHAPVTVENRLTGETIQAVPLRIEQILVNLLNNAARHTPRSGRITVSTEKLREKWIRIGVSDTGSGIAASALDRVFERFYTADKQSGSTGLGLDLAKLLVQQHGGRIAVASTEGQGSTFTVDLPTG